MMTNTTAERMVSVCRSHLQSRVAAAMKHPTIEPKTGPIRGPNPYSDWALPRSFGANMSPILPAPKLGPVLPAAPAKKRRILRDAKVGEKAEARLKTMNNALVMM